MNPRRFFLARLFADWLSARAREREAIRRDAAKLIQEHGPEGAYLEARYKAMYAKRRDPPDFHWAKVRAEIGRRTNCKHVDTATRYLWDKL